MDVLEGRRGREIGERRRNGGGQGKTYKMIQNLISNNPHHLKTLLARHRINKHIPMNPNKMLRIQDTVFILHRNVNKAYPHPNWVQTIETNCKPIELEPRV
jgi:hypothetical protein